MKNNLKMFSTLATLALSCAFAVNNFAQVKTGGYKKIAKTDAAVVAAAEFAAQSQSKNDDAEITVQSIEKAESQTVAGTNYKLCIEVFRIEAGDDVEIRQFIQTLVFRSLKKEYSLKSWEEAESCGE